MSIANSLSVLDRLVYGQDERPWVVAEIGVNHDGDMAVMRGLIRAAKEARCDAVKLQVYNVELHPPERRDLLRKYALTRDMIDETAAICKREDIVMFGTPDDEGSCMLLSALNVPLVKVSSADVRNLPLLKIVAGMDVPVLLSTGMSTPDELRHAYQFLGSLGAKVVPMHCTSGYPTALDESALGVLERMTQIEKWRCVGFSDHTIGAYTAAAAVATGARIFEKHITLSTNRDGPDHKMSTGPSDLAIYVDVIWGTYQSFRFVNRGVFPWEAESRRIADRRLEWLAERASS